MGTRRSWRSVGLLAVVLATTVVVLAAVASVTPGAPHHPVGASTPTTTVAAAPPTTVLDNPFLPDERNLTDCVSAVPKPGCGSEARGGWRQTVVFAVMVAGLGVIAWRIVRGARRARLRA